MSSPELPRGQLTVKVFEAHGTRAAEAYGIGSADPYGIVKLANFRERTKAAESAGSKPVWNQTFTFDLPTSDRKYNELTISLHDANKWRKDTPIGESRINLASLVAEKGNSIPSDWYPVFFNGKQQGWIYVGIDFTPKPDRSAPKKEKATVTDNSGTSIPEVPKNVPSTGDDEDGVPKEPEEGVRSPEGKAESGIQTLDSSTPGGPPSNSPTEPQDHHPPEGESESRPPTVDDKASGKAPSESPEEDQYHSPKGEAEPGSPREDDSTPGEANRQSKRPTENHQSPHGDGLSPENEDNTGGGQVTPKEDQQSPSPPLPKHDGSSPGGPNSTKGNQDGPGPGKEGGESEEKKPGTASPDQHEDKPGEAIGNASPDQHEDKPGEAIGTESPDQHEDKPREAIKSAPAKSGGGPYNAAASILEASKGLGRKLWFNYAAVPSLLISLLVLAAIQRKKRSIHDGGNADSRAFSLEESTSQGSRGMPTSTRQKILFYRIYGSP